MQFSRRTGMSLVAATAFRGHPVRLFIGALALVFAASCIVKARDAAQLKADLATIMPAGMKARLVWIKGGNFTEFQENSNNTVVYKVDSDDGIISTLYPTSGNGHYYRASVTADGSRVIFYDGNSNKVCIVNWDGSGFKSVDMGGQLSQYWRNPADGSDWAVIYSTSGNLQRVRIDATSTRVVVVPSPWAWQLSEDGTTALVDAYDRSPSPCFGLYSTANSTYAFGPHWGCGPEMGPGTPCRYHHNPQGGHVGMCVHDGSDQSKYHLYPLADSISAYLKRKGLQNEWSAGGYSAESSRFTHHPDFATTMIGWSKVDPFLIHLPDLKYVYIEDNLPSNTFCGDVDAVFLPKSTGVAPGNAMASAGLHRTIMSQDAYLPDGRRVNPALLAAKSKRGNTERGVVIWPIQGKGPAASMTAVVPW